MKTVAITRNETSGYHWIQRLKQLRSVFLPEKPPEHQASAEMTVIYCAMGHGFIRIQERCDPPSEACEIQPENSKIRGLPAVP